MKNGIGFGSTEYIVIRANNKLVIPEWIYYFINEDTLLPAQKIIQVGGAVVKGADIVLAGDNRKLTQDEITKWVNSL